MKRYTVQISDAASSQLAKLAQKEQRRINARIIALADDPRPHGSVKLSGSASPEQYRIRSGDYRIIYGASSRKRLPSFGGAAFTLHRSSGWKSRPGKHRSAG